MEKYKKLITIIIILVIIFALLVPKQNAASNINVYFLSVGGGDCVAINCDGKWRLIDAGDGNKSYYKNYVVPLIQKVDSNKASEEEKKIVEKYCRNTDLGSLINNKYVAKTLKELLGNQTFDFVIATHSHSDHIGGIPEVVDAGLINAKTTYYYKPYVFNKSDESGRYACSWRNEMFYYFAKTKVESSGAKMFDVTTKKDGLNFKLGSADFKLYNLSKGSYNDNDENDNSITTLMTINGKKVYFASDMGLQKQNKYSKIIGDVDVLKPAHHGQSNETTLSSMQDYLPEYIILSHNDNIVNDEHRMIAATLYLSGQNVLKGFYNTNNQVGDYIKLSIGANGSIDITPAKGSKYKGDIHSLEFPTSTWYKDGENQWVYCNSKRELHYGWLNLKGKWYFFNDKGIMVKGWKTVDEKTYYFNNNGEMLCNTTTTIDGKTYTFNSSGALQGEKKTEETYTSSNTATPQDTKARGNSYGISMIVYKYPKIKYSSGEQIDYNGLELGIQLENGDVKLIDSGYDAPLKQAAVINGKNEQTIIITYNRPLTNYQTLYTGYKIYIDKEVPQEVENKQYDGWILENRKYSYYANGNKTIGFRKIGSDYYYLDQDGYMQTGFITVDGIDRYFDNEGHLKRGWLYAKLNEKYSWFYCDKDNGQIYKNTTRFVEDKDYTFDSEGRSNKTS